MLFAACCASRFAALMPSTKFEVFATRSTISEPRLIAIENPFVFLSGLRRTLVQAVGPVGCWLSSDENAVRKKALSDCVHDVLAHYVWNCVPELEIRFDGPAINSVHRG